MVGEGRHHTLSRGGGFIILGARTERERGNILLNLGGGEDNQIN